MASTSSRDDLQLEPDNEPVMELNWYHPNLTRHAAECMLIDNAPEGTYLLRPNMQEANKFSLSVKCQRAVLHFIVTRNRDGSYTFGEHSFKNLNLLKHHFQEEQPVIGGEGTMVTLKTPYTRFIREPHAYVRVTYHAMNKMEETSTSDDDKAYEEVTTNQQIGVVGMLQSVKGETMGRMLAVGSKEGYLTKLGGVIKSWRKRWFVLRNYKLSYFKSHQSASPIKVINLTEATEVDYDNSTGKENCFKIVLPWRTFFIYALTPEECQSWVEVLSTKFGTSLKKT